MKLTESEIKKVKAFTKRLVEARSSTVPETIKQKYPGAYKFFMKVYMSQDFEDISKELDDMVSGEEIEDSLYDNVFYTLDNLLKSAR